MSAILFEMVDRHCLTAQQGRAPEFKVQSNDGKLVLEAKAPEAVVKNTIVETYLM